MTRRLVRGALWDAWDRTLGRWISRLACRGFGLHSRFCRGRGDHDPHAYTERLTWL